HFASLGSANTSSTGRTSSRRWPRSTRRSAGGPATGCAGSSSSEERCGSCVPSTDRVEGYDIKEAPMRTTLIYVFALAAVPSASLAGAEPGRVDVALRKLRQEFVSAVNAGDLERAMACWSTGVRIMVEGRAPIEGPAPLECTRRKSRST